MADTVRRWLVCLVPRYVCLWMWQHSVPLGGWTPFVLERVLGGEDTTARWRY